MKNFFKQQRELLIIIAYALFIVGLVWLVVLPLMNKISETRDKIQEEQIKQEISKKRLDELPKFKGQYKSLEDVDLQQYLFDKNNAVALIEKLEFLAAQSNNKISITVQEQAANKQANAKPKKDVSITDDLPNTNYLQFKIVVNGDFNSIVKFIKSLESFEFHSDIIGLQIRGAKETVSNNQNSGGIFSASGSQPENNNSKGDLEGVLDVVFYAR